MKEGLIIIIIIIIHEFHGDTNLETKLQGRIVKKMAKRSILDLPFSLFFFTPPFPFRCSSAVTLALAAPYHQLLILLCTSHAKLHHNAQISS